MDLPYRVDHRLEASADRRDRAVWCSPPDSLHLDAHVPGDGYWRFPERPVHAGYRYRLSFHYLVAMGSVGSCSVKVNQYQDTENSWKALDRGTIDRTLPVVGRWETVTLDFTTEPDATSVAVTFRIGSECDVFECWIDDAVLRPVGMPITVGP